jgi:hypothetical protein
MMIFTFNILMIFYINLINLLLLSQEETMITEYKQSFVN